MKTFDLERALAGDPVVTRNGRKVLGLHFCDIPNLDYPIWAVITDNDGFEFENWTKDGKYILDDLSGEESSYDLFMASKKSKRWIWIEDIKNNIAWENKENLISYIKMKGKQLEDGQIIEIEVDE